MRNHVNCAHVSIYHRETSVSGSLDLVSWWECSFCGTRFTPMRATIEACAKVVEEADVETFRSYGREDNGRLALQKAAAAIRALAESVDG